MASAAFAIRSGAGSGKAVVSTKRFLLRFLPAMAIWSIATGAFSPFFNAYFSQYLHVPVQKIGLIFSASQFVQVGAILLAPVVFRKFGLVGGIMYMQIATALALTLLAKSSTVSVIAFTYAGFSALQWMSEPGMYTLLMNRVGPAERSGASALNALVIAGFQALAALVAGGSFVRYGYLLCLSVRRRCVDFRRAFPRLDERIPIERSSARGGAGFIGAAVVPAPVVTPAQLVFASTAAAVVGVSPLRVCRHRSGGEHLSLGGFQ